MQKLLCQLDAIVPFAPILRRVVHVGVEGLWPAILLRALPLTVAIYWIGAQIPLVGSLPYTLLLVPLAAWHHIGVNGISTLPTRAGVLLWYFAVIASGAGNLAQCAAMASSGTLAGTGLPLALGLAGLASLRWRGLALPLMAAQTLVWLATFRQSADPATLLLAGITTVVLGARLWPRPRTG